MPVICPSILAATTDEYRQQIERVSAFAERIQIDLTDGEFAKGTTVKPEEVWWPVGLKADFHLMYKRPDKAIDSIIDHKPHMIIVHAEADGNFLTFAHRCRDLGIKSGVALLPRTGVDAILNSLNVIDHVLVFSGDLGSYGGHANFDLLHKVQALKAHRADLEVGWDGGINDQNISRLASQGVDVFDVGGYIQDAPNAEHAYHILARIAEETGTT